MVALKGLNRKDLVFLIKKTKSKEEREEAVKELLRRDLTVEELHEVFLLSPSSLGKICEKLVEKIGHVFAAIKVRIWSQENPDRLAQMLL